MKAWDENEFALLEDYLTGRLSPDAKLHLEQRLREDANLKQQLDELSLLQQGIRNAGRNEMLSTIARWEKAAQQKENATIPLWKNPWAVGIAATLLVALSWFLYSPDHNNPAKTFALHFEPYPNVVMPTVRGSSPLGLSPLEEGFSAYDNSEFERAAALFENVEIKDETVWLYLGNCYLGMGKATEAAKALEHLKQGGHPFVQQGQWYLALAYVLKGDNQNALLLLQSLENDSIYGQRAVDLQQSLNKE